MKLVMHNICTPSLVAVLLAVTGGAAARVRSCSTQTPLGVRPAITPCKPCNNAGKTLPAHT